MPTPEGERQPNQPSPTDLGAKEITTGNHRRRILPNSAVTDGNSIHMRAVGRGSRGPRPRR